jgi:hypothetical protein
MTGDLCCVVVNEVANPVMRNPPKLRPGPEGAKRRFLVLWEDPAATQADDVGELATDRRIFPRFHTNSYASTATTGAVNVGDTASYTRILL